MPPKQAPSPEPSSNEENNGRLDALARKKKNADAQAAFRARRSYYIATLEETVLYLEDIIMNIQWTNKGLVKEVEELKRERNRMADKFSNLENMWTTMWKAGKVDQPPPSDAYAIAYPTPPNPPQNEIPPMHPVAARYPDDGMRYPSAVNPSPVVDPHYQNGPPDYPQRSPGITYAGVRQEGPMEGSSQHVAVGGVEVPYGYSPYAMGAAGGDGTWGQAGVQADGSLAPQSPAHTAFSESPILTESAPLYAPRYTDDEQRSDALGLSYTSAPSRANSISPTHTTASSSSVHTTAPGSAPAANTGVSFPFQFPSEPQSAQARLDVYRRIAMARGGGGGGPQINLHGGTASITGTAATVGEALRQKLTSGRADPSSPYARRDSTGSTIGHPILDRARSQADAPGAAGPSRRGRNSQICGTLAIIKAQAFGQVRRTRTRDKKGTEGAAKAARDALEARLGPGILEGIPYDHHRDDDPDYMP